MNARARRARAALRERRHWDVPQLIAAQPNLVAGLRQASRFRPVKRVKTLRAIEIELARRLFPDSL